MKNKPTALLVADLGFGDAGKGSIVDALTRRYNAYTVVRYNGGAQAAHNVVLPGGVQHTFAQFSAGFFSGAKTYLSEYMLVEPLAFQNEALHLKILGYSSPEKTVFVNSNAIVTTPFHIIANRQREIERHDDRHGSCGMGIGETVQDYLKGLFVTVAELSQPILVREKLEFIRRHKLGFNFDSVDLDEVVERYYRFSQSVNIADTEWFEKELSQGVVIFEGAQGVLLDEWHGFHPYTTWSTTTFENADNILSGYQGEIIKLGLARSHMIRHGPGPLPTEDSLVKQQIHEYHNKFGEWQRDVRFGWLDLVLLGYSLQSLGRVDYLVLNHADQIPLCDGYLRFCSAYADQQPKPIVAEKNNSRLVLQQELMDMLFSARPIYSDYKIKSTAKHDLMIKLANELGVPVGVVSNGNLYRDKSYAAGLDTKVMK